MKGSFAGFGKIISNFLIIKLEQLPMPYILKAFIGFLKASNIRLKLELLEFQFQQLFFYCHKKNKFCFDFTALLKISLKLNQKINYQVSDHLSHKVTFQQLLMYFETAKINNGAINLVRLQSFPKI